MPGATVYNGPFQIMRVEHCSSITFLNGKAIAVQVDYYTFTQDKTNAYMVDFIKNDLPETRLILVISITKK